MIVGVTGDLYEESVSRFKQSGADEVMSKPLDVKRLVQVYENALMQYKIE